ncbi:MAG: hypothetical protein KDA41_08930 [Planctomycetales bacterium]|nr:hypothetical protein [Planctomycetales bacterium]
MKLPASGAVGGAQAHCSECDTELPLREPHAREQPIVWECARCGRSYLAVLDEKAPADSRFNVYPGRVHFRCVETTRSREAVAQFVDDLIPRPSVAVELRKSPRSPVALAACAMPLDATQTPVGAAFMVMVQNISHSGVAFTHMQPLAHPYVALEFYGEEDAKMKVVMQVLRMRNLGSFCEIAGEFLVDED